MVCRLSYCARKTIPAYILPGDLAALIFRTEVFKPDEIIYVVGDEQSLHFRQLFALLARLATLTAQKSNISALAWFLSDGEKMSTRKGTLIELENLIKQSVAKSKEILRHKK